MTNIKLSTKKTAIALVLGATSLVVGGCSSIGGPNAGLTDTALANDNSRPYALQRHLYAGVGLGRSFMEPDTSEVPGTDVNDRYEAGGQATLGLDVTRHLAIEGHAADLGSAGLSSGGRINYHINGASALLYAGGNRSNFKRAGFTGFGRIGLGVLDNSKVGNAADFIQDNGTHVLLGAGLEYMTRVGLGLRAEAISFDEDVNYFQLGLVYRAGKRRTQAPAQIVKAPVTIKDIVPAAPIAVPAVVVAKPAPAPVDTCQELNGALDGVNFHSASARLTDESQRVLDTVASRITECGSSPIRISAHTDSQGAADYNQSLSEQRADSVATYLSGRGVDGSRLRTEAFGESQPIGSNDTSEGRRMNRRVELNAGY